jgi:class 3 adenylate cyclase
MDEARQTAVLFADVAESTRLYETVGDAAALEAIELCLEELRQATQDAGGRVIKTIGDEIMALFPGPDSAAGAAAEMQFKVERLPMVGSNVMGVRIGFHSGPVMQRDGDVFGDTVNLAARLVSQAVRGQIITSSETMELLSPMFRRWTRRLYAIQVKGKAAEVDLCELLWNQRGDETVLAIDRSGGDKTKQVQLRLKFHGGERVLRRNPDSLSLGRDPSAGIVINDNMASRNHCTIERRQDKYLLSDHSSNGTFLTVEDEAEVTLRRETLVLRKHGWIAFGQPRASATEVIEYFCD